MPKLSDTKTPAYRLHAGSGQALVVLSGRHCYLGVYNSPASKAKYDRLIAEWIANGRQLRAEPDGLTIAELIKAFRRHALEYYRDAEGIVSGAVVNIDQ